MDKKFTPQKLIAFMTDTISWSLSGGIGYQLFLCSLMAVMLLGVFAYFTQFDHRAYVRRFRPLAGYLAGRLGHQH